MAFMLFLFHLLADQLQQKTNDIPNISLKLMLFSTHLEYLLHMRKEKNPQLLDMQEVKKRHERT